MQLFKIKISIISSQASTKDFQALGEASCSSSRKVSSSGNQILKFKFFFFFFFGNNILIESVSTLIKIHTC